MEMETTFSFHFQFVCLFVSFLFSCFFLFSFCRYYCLSDTHTRCYVVAVISCFSFLRFSASHIFLLLLSMCGYDEPYMRGEGGTIIRMYTMYGRLVGRLVVVVVIVKLLESWYEMRRTKERNKNLTHWRYAAMLWREECIYFG